ncbi:MAG: TonB-dependent receptor [Marinifilaceae bacterium]|nr:TonB-dependent receptor [Marinifilaceae bacterium]
MSRFRLLVLFLCISKLCFPQKNFTISGNIKDSNTGEDLLFATVYIVETKAGAQTNEYGYYAITAPKGEYTLKFSFVGYKEFTKKVTINGDLRINIELNPSDTKLDEIVVSGEAADKNVSRNESSVINLKLSEAKELPVLLGEQDIIKTMQLLPGVSSSGEGGNGFHVRGGSIGNNLVLLDESPVYNASHLMGFFSVFNSDAIKDMKMFKGGTPAQYGGRSSSVLDLRMKDGNSKKYGLSGGIGLLSSRLMLEGPTIKDKGSFMISGRRTYMDLFFPLSSKESLKKSKLYFYDLNLKINHQLGKNDRLYASAYLGRDVLDFDNRFGFNWGNITSTVRWNHLFNNKFFLNTTFIYSEYDYDFDINSNNSKMNLKSGINTIELKQDYSYLINSNNKLKFGFSTAKKTFNPGEFNRTDVDIVENTEIAKSDVLESGIYLSNSLNIGSSLKIDYGARYSLFNVLGGRNFYTYDNSGEITDIKYYKKNKNVKTYSGFEPRLMASYMINNKSSVKISYNRMNQYIHLMSNSTAGSPTDYWIPSSPNIEPQKTDQYTLGYFRNFANNNIEFSVEGYYKQMKNMIEYKNGTSIMLNEHIESDLLFGKGRAYGAEFLLKKNNGRFKGWIAYTLSKTEKKFDDINAGSWFPAKYDRTHDISLVAMYKLNKKWSFSASWVFQTGSAVTFPTGTYDIDGANIKLYSDRNAYRMPDYHRLDLGATCKLKETKRFSSELVFSLYNAYGRKNAYSISFQENVDTGKNEAVKLSLFQYVPSITWNFKIK